MAYLGNTPQIGQYRYMDTPAFDGSQTTFPITVAGVGFAPPTVYTMMVSLNNVVKNPGVDYSISGSTISFVTAPAALTPCPATP